MSEQAKVVVKRLSALEAVMDITPEQVRADLAEIQRRKDELRAEEVILHLTLDLLRTS
jgi:hypothetical protein